MLIKVRYRVTIVALHMIIYVIFRFCSQRETPFLDLHSFATKNRVILAEESTTIYYECFASGNRGIL